MDMCGIPNPSNTNKDDCSIPSLRGILFNKADKGNYVVTPKPSKVNKTRGRPANAEGKAKTQKNPPRKRGRPKQNDSTQGVKRRKHNIEAGDDQNTEVIDETDNGNNVVEMTEINQIVEI